MNRLIETGAVLNIAAIRTRTRALGPGLRAGIWFQGCPFDCHACISPAWVEKKEVYLIKPDDLIETFIHDPELNGLTISGGEPFFQPSGLNQLVRKIHNIRPDFTIIVFTGFILDQLERMPDKNQIQDTLSLIDILIDGPYQEKLNNNLGLRGSSNQKIHRLSQRLASYNFEDISRINEVFLENGTIQISGVPDGQLRTILASRNLLKKEVYDVRT